MSKMPPSFLFLLFSLLSTAFPSGAHFPAPSDSQGFISALISEKGLVFVKDLLVEQALSSLTPLLLPDIDRALKIPFVGRVQVSLSNITLSSVHVSSSYIKPGDTGVAIVASGATANLTMNWRYSYSTWLVPIKISDQGSAFIQVQGMEVGTSVGMQNQEGSLKLTIIECGCHLKHISITLDGGASWFYQGLVDIFGGRIRSAVENAITKKIREGFVKLDTILQGLPKEIRVDDFASLNVTFVNDPIFHNSSVGFEINGLFTMANKVTNPNYVHMNSRHSVSCGDPLKMLWISLDEAVFKSASDIYFKAGEMHWTVDKVPDQSLLNTAAWKYVVPQLYKKYPNDNLQLNISLTSPPMIRLTKDKIDVTVFLDMIIDVLEGDKIVHVACISMDISGAGHVEVSGNNLGGQAELDDFTLNLKWSQVGNIHMYLVQTVLRAFLKNVAVPYVNARLRRGFPLPIIRGFALQDANIVCSDSRINVCCDVTYADSSSVTQLPSYYW